MGNFAQDVYRSDRSLQQDQDNAFLRDKAGRLGVIPGGRIKKEALPHTDMIRPRPCGIPTREAGARQWAEFVTWINQKKPVLDLAYKSVGKNRWRAYAGSVRLDLQVCYSGFRAKLFVREREGGMWVYVGQGYSQENGTPEQATHAAMSRGFFTDGFSWRPLTDVLRVYVSIEGMKRSKLMVGQKTVVWQSVPFHRGQDGWWANLPFRTWHEAEVERPIVTGAAAKPHSLKPLPDSLKASEYKPEPSKEIHFDPKWATDRAMLDRVLGPVE